jgi:predicted unusual protein kinase regulating ubiquinone biosynthesis (AarF/ABC1/UbiB family)
VSSSPPPSGTDITPIVPALGQIWRDSKGQSLADFNFRTVTSKFNELVYQYPIRIPERYSLVIRSLLTQVCVMRVCACVWGGGWLVAGRVWAQ